MSDQTYLTAAYICMIGALALWTWTVFARSNNLQQKIESLEKAISRNDTSTAEGAEENE